MAQVEINEEKQGSITYSMDRENKVSKIFIISLRFNWMREKGTAFNFSGSHSEIRPSKLTNHTASSN